MGDLVVGDLITFTERHVINHTGLTCGESNYLHRRLNLGKRKIFPVSWSREDERIIERQTVARVLKLSLDERSCVQLEIVGKQYDDTNHKEGWIIHRSEEDVFAYEVRRACWDNDDDSRR